MGGAGRKEHLVRTRQAGTPALPLTDLGSATRPQPQFLQGHKEGSPSTRLPGAGGSETRGAGVRVGKSVNIPITVLQNHLPFAKPRPGKDLENQLLIKHLHGNRLKPIFIKAKLYERLRAHVLLGWGGLCCPPPLPPALG